MSDQFELHAEVREDMGKGASRRLRRLAGQVPAIIYGGDKDPQPLTLIRKDLEKALENEAFYSHVLTINVGKEKQKAILKDLQRHPARESVMHADFLRVNENKPIKLHVPILRAFVKCGHNYRARRFASRYPTRFPYELRWLGSGYRHLLNSTDQFRLLNRPCPELLQGSDFS